MYEITSIFKNNPLPGIYNVIGETSITFMKTHCKSKLWLSYQSSEFSAS